MNKRAALIAYYTIVEKEARRTMRLWVQTIFPPMITTLMYFVIFGHVIGSRIGSMSQIPYIDYIAPGLMIMPLILNAFASGSASFFSAKMMKQIEELLVSPMSNFTMLLGFMTGGMVRGLIVGLSVTIVTLFFAQVHFIHPFIMLVIVLLSSAFFSLLGIFNGVFAKSFDDITLIPNFVLSPLIYLGGVFYSVNLLPPFWRDVSYFNPIFYIIEAFRYSFLGIHHTAIYPAVCVLLLMTISLFFLVWWLFVRGFRLRH